MSEADIRARHVPSEHPGLMRIRANGMEAARDAARSDADRLAEVLRDAPPAARRLKWWYEVVGPALATHEGAQP